MASGFHPLVPEHLRLPTSHSSESPAAQQAEGGARLDLEWTHGDLSPGSPVLLQSCQDPSLPLERHVFQRCCCCGTCQVAAASPAPSLQPGREEAQRPAAHHPALSSQLPGASFDAPFCRRCLWCAYQNPCGPVAGWRHVLELQSVAMGSRAGPQEKERPLTSSPPSFMAKASAEHSLTSPLCAGTSGLQAHRLQSQPGPMSPSETSPGLANLRPTLVFGQQKAVRKR